MRTAGIFNGLALAIAIACCARAPSDPPDIPLTTAIPPPIESAAPAASTPIAITSASVAPSASTPHVPEPAPKWPVRCESPTKACTTPQGEPGMKCGDDGACGNPCRKGFAPEQDNLTYCGKICASDKDCGADKCKDGVCDRWTHLACATKDIEDCSIGKSLGQRCKGGPCVHICKKGLALYGGTHCAKPCSRDAQCPDGSCAVGFCVPLCPSEGCPYRWE